MFGLDDFEAASAEEHDCTLYGFRKFMRMAAKGTVQALEMLFADESDVLASDADGDGMRRHRTLFLTKRVGKTFSGFAFAAAKEALTEKASSAEVGLYGYDTKSAAHALRLLRSASEALRTGHLSVRRPDAAELRAVRNGSLRPEEFAVMGQRDGRLVFVAGLFHDEQRLFDEAFAASRLPDEPDHAAVNALAVRLSSRRYAAR